MTLEQTPARRPHELRDLVSGNSVTVDAARRPTAGPIAVLPAPTPLFADAVTDAGGIVEPISDNTRGLVWLAPRDDAGLQRVLAEHPGIEWVQLPWAGVDAYADALAAHAGRAVPLWTSAKGAYAEPVAEHALALTLALLREIPTKARSTSWASPRTGETLFGARVVIVGAGGIALELVRMLAVFSVEITIVRRSASPFAGASRVVTSEHLLEVLPEADVVIVAAASTTDTAKMFDESAIAAMRPTAVLVNVARGGLVDSMALDAALRSGSLAGAGLDVTDPEPLPDGHPLWTAPNVVITSHSADTQEMADPLLASRVRSNVAAFLGDGDFVGIVDPASGY